LYLAPSPNAERSTPNGIFVLKTGLVTSRRQEKNQEKAETPQKALDSPKGIAVLNL